MIDSARIGDRVKVQMDPEARGWGAKAPPDGIEGTIIGRKRIIRYRSRFGLDRNFYEPGVYAEDGTIIVKFDTIDEPVEGLDYSLRFVDPAVEAERGAEYRSFEGEYSAREIHYRNIIRLHDLPDTKFWEGDIVRRVDSEEIMKIVSIEWHWDRRPYQVMWIDPATGEDARQGHTYLDGDVLELVERGNTWREANGEPLVFKSLQDEIKYASGCGRSTSVRNPANNLFLWSKDEALTAIAAGIADGFSLASGIFGSGPSINVTQFADRDLGERVRQETLRGFALI